MHESIDRRAPKLAAFLVRCCEDVQIDSKNLFVYLRDKKCTIKSPYRPFDEIEQNVACAIIDLRKRAMELPPEKLMDTGYDAGCADVARIPLILLTDRATKVLTEWLICEHVYKANKDNIGEVVDIFVTSIHKFQKELDLAVRADIVARRELRQQLINSINETINSVSKFIRKKRKAI